MIYVLLLGFHWFFFASEEYENNYILWEYNFYRIFPLSNFVSSICIALRIKPGVFFTYIFQAHSPKHCLTTFCMLACFCGQNFQWKRQKLGYCFTVGFSGNSLSFSSAVNCQFHQHVQAWWTTTPSERTNKRNLKTMLLLHVCSHYVLNSHLVQCVT